jgi:LCP family protein required for cell wall assembly
MNQMSNPYAGAPPRKSSWLKKFFWGFFLLALAAGIAYGSFFAWKIYSVGKKVSRETSTKKISFVSTLKNLAEPKIVDLKSASPERINILLLGMAGEGKPGTNLTDTIMIASLNPETGKVALLSIPRDLYVPIPDERRKTKINTVYQSGLRGSGKDPGTGADLIKKTVADFTGLSLDYCVILNFSGFEKIIDAIDGINIVSERDIYDERYPGPNYSYETFALKKGFHHLDGATALKYARERHADPEGDFGRAKRQQQVLQAAKNKIFSAGVLLNPFALNGLLDELGENIQTDISPDEIGTFLELVKKLDTQNINNVVLTAWDKDSLLKVSHVDLGGAWAFVLVPRIGNWSEVRDLAQNIFDTNAIKRKRAEIAKEEASIAIVNRSGDNLVLDRVKKLLSENLDYKNIEITTPEKTIAEKTLVFDQTDGAKPFTLNELATKLPAEVSFGQPPEPIYQNKPDIILAIGKDLIEKYNMEEATIDDLNKARDDQEAQNLNNP